MKNTKFNTLYTDAGELFDKSSPLPEYPRPQFVRDSYISLNGEWDFCEASEPPETYTEKITVPYPMESALSGIEREHDTEKTLFYRKRFSLPEGFNRGTVILHFGAVDTLCTVSLNGIHIAENRGGYHPFSLDISSALVDGENELSLSVTDTLDKKYPYGKQTKKRGGMWYTPVSGIWQSVWLESYPCGAIESIKTETDTISAEISVKTASPYIKLTLEDGSEYESIDGKFSVKPECPICWSPENPHLYYFTLETKTDKVKSYFALRTISVGETEGVKRLLLNGEPYLFSGLLDQGYFPDGIFTPASYAVYEKDIMTAKEHGFNMLRKHIKIEPMYFYYLCDKLGIAVFQDMVNNSDYSFIRDTALPTLGMKRLSDKKLHRDKEARENFVKGMKDTIALLENTPSVLYYTIFNEGWGQFSADENYRLAKTLDKTRIFDATSGWFWQSESDVDSHHIYFKKAKIKDFSKKPVVLSEFGGYSHRVKGHLFGDANYGYRRFNEQKEFENAFTRLYKDEVLPLVKAGISALVYTQLTDIEDETNGIVSYDRRVYKLDKAACKKLMQELYDAVPKSGTVTE